MSVGPSVPEHVRAVLHDRVAAHGADRNTRDVVEPERASELGEIISGRSVSLIKDSRW